MTSQISTEPDSGQQVLELEHQKTHQTNNEQVLQSILKPCSENESRKEEEVSLSAETADPKRAAKATLHVQEPPLMESPRKLLQMNMESQQKGGGVEESGRERLKRHRVEVAGRVWIPDMWGQEELLKDWIDCSAFDASLMNSNIMLARAALVQERSRANSTRLRIENSC